MTEPRDLALQALYEQETAAGASTAELTGKAADLVDGVNVHRHDLDRVIEEASSGWRVARMPVVDRNILRLAVYELGHRPSTPIGVIINEAVRLAKTYSTARSGAFVNGVLAAVARHLRPVEPGPGEMPAP